MTAQNLLCGPDGTLNAEWEVTLVALSCIVAVGGSFAALDCAERMRSASSPKSRRRYFLAGASLMGVSIWTMHFVGMLAHRLRIPVQYDPTLSIVSVAAAALGAGLAFLIVNRSVITLFHVLTGGVAMGLAIASMHYLGMASMRIPASISYDPPLFTASIGIAIAASAGALALARLPISRGRIRYWIKSISALAMGAAIAGMHYVGMAAARYVPTGSTQAGEGAQVGTWSLQMLLVAASVIILGALLAMMSKTAAERQLALESLEEKRNEAITALRAKDTFLAMLSHELRTPLNPALLIATDASNNPEFSAAAKDAFRTIGLHIMLEARLIDDLLDVTRISRGVLKVEPRPVDVHALLNDSIGIIRPDMAARKLELTVELGAHQTFVFADPIRIQQVFWNLLQNAAKYNRPGGRIRVGTKNEGSDILVEVSDTGIGMTESEIARCFEKFEQGGHNLGGLGLGLSISRNIVELHRGSIVATSRGKDHGATFTVLLHTMAAPAETSAADVGTVSPEDALPKLSVLLVEDHDASRVSLQRLLQRRGHEVVSAATCSEALEAAQRNKFDLLVSDIGLPDGDGYQLMRTLAAQQPVLGVAVTGYGTDEDLQRALAAGYSAHVVKPVTIRKLDEAITVALNRAKPRAGA